MKSTYGMNTKQFRNIRKRSFTGKKIENTKRVERVLSLIKYLNEFRAIKEIAIHLNIHRKSVNRYLNLLCQLGFDVEVSHSKYHYYKITNIKEYFKK